MRIAKDIRGNYIWVSSNIEGYCPECREKLIIKSGPLVAKHYSHKPDSSCLINTGQMTEWHIIWQSKFENKEVFSNDKKNIADVMLKNGLVLEFQHSSISIKDMKKRENQWLKMFWLFNLIDNKNFAYNGDFFLWDYPKTRFLYYTKPGFFHIENDLVVQFTETIFKSKLNKGNYEFKSMKGKLIKYTVNEWIDLCINIDFKYKDFDQHFNIRQHEL